jgi:hypothetical protein
MFAVPRAHQPVSAIAVGILIAPSRLQQTQPLSGGHPTQPILPDPIVAHHRSPVDNHNATLELTLLATL